MRYCPKCKREQRTKRRLSACGQTATGKPVQACPWCLSVYAPNGSLREPTTPRWRDDERVGVA